MKLDLFLVTGKEARKKELKKNKKQRQLVRAAVLKGKDPAQIIEEMEKIDQMGLYGHYTLIVLYNNVRIICVTSCIFLSL